MEKKTLANRNKTKPKPKKVKRSNELLNHFLASKPMLPYLDK